MDEQSSQSKLQKDSLGTAQETRVPWIMTWQHKQSCNTETSLSKALDYHQHDSCFIDVFEIISHHLHICINQTLWIAAAQKYEKTLSKRNADLIKRYNRTAHALSPLRKGDTVSIQNPNSHRWDIAGRIVETLPNR